MAAPLPRSVKLLGWTSLFTDAATEAIYPLLPIFVTRVLGGTAMSLGLIEGAAEAIASVLKIVSGRMSDRTGRRRPFVIAGYSLAWLARPLIALAATWQHVFAVRLVDRIGKGLRGAPRDAMLAALAPEGERGRVFGYHRAMDHLGAVIGPLAAALFLWFLPGQYRALFALTFIPGALAVAMLLFVPEVGVTPQPTVPTNQPNRPDQTTSRQPLPVPLKRFFFILAIFTLGNSTDAFLLLRLSDAGLPTIYLPIVWAGLHMIKSALSTAGGALSDRVGRRRLIVGGWLLYAVVYAGFAFSESLVALLAWFFAYGLYFAMVEGSEKALVTDLSPAASRGTAFGWYNGVLGFGALAASVLFGTLWHLFGPHVAFLSGAGLALTAAAVLASDRRLASPS
ncbi:MAG TPA: MFS transporter [Vicinamibacterales bacterium]|nr:MFS transporter [Vicinamibacterales bacterium]